MQMAEFEVLEYLIGKLIDDLSSKGTPVVSITRLEDVS